MSSKKINKNNKNDKENFKDFKGNKSFLPQKICKTCEKPMVWRASWAKNWDQVLYCSTRCKNNK